MSVRAILLYPFKAGSTFNINYYISTHMPSVAKLYGPYGLVRWEVLQFSGDETSPYIVQTVLFWDNLDQLNAANSSDGAKYLREDIKNFSSVMPVALVGNIAGQS
ncbi:hypothetical protein AUEXF2481DRAFT_704467 [Aureobasidium subglaciale EXF-2481]|uniref:EthD domain-containing protein n=1 Tax=Aureobasidium subglaciale (strain EXF-2481) TaxID=1043005 RepID=A0A074Y322_AURSE|nr:uncharacterized protein AUEXF2481DRAFT_704467 [Aureobasidium subglaciale EXF-2481]KEQ90349.1 hypothetical protein AUEXF2481DRAFT_704467 [Aureobasidium subglaciale EXF-2481]